MADIKYTSEQLDAIYTPISNTIVSAGAGSGKTKVLTARVIDHVLHDIDIDRLLILTFTNAAAASMKLKIRDALIEDSDLDEEKKKSQLNKIDSSYIMTFDAYSLFLVKKYHSLLNIDKDIEVADDNIIDSKIIEILNEILEEKYKGLDTTFNNLINTYCIKNDDAIREFIINLNNKLNLIYDRKEYVSNYEDNFFSDSKLNEYLNLFTDILINRLQNVDKMLNTLSMEVNLDDIYVNYAGINALSSYADIKAYLENFASTSKRLKGTSDEYKKIKAKLTKEINELKEITSFTEQELKDQILNTKDYCLCLLDIVEMLNDKLYEYKKANNLYTFNDVARLAIKVIEENIEIRNEIKEHFKEILVDEYQDTSDNQELLISLISNNNVYVVGDIKQSIYRFRNANPDIFKDKYDKYSKGIDGKKIDLTYNFRSRKEVLDNINIFFNRLMTRNVGGADYKTNGSLTAGNGSYDKAKCEDYNMNIYSYDEKDELCIKYGKDVVEAYIVAKDIQDKVNKFKLKDGVAKYSDFTILLDRGARFDIFKKVLTYFNIPVYIDTEERMSESDLLSVLRSIFRLLVDEDDKHAYVSIERSFLCETNDEEIYKNIKDYKNTPTYKKILNIKENIDNKTIAMVLDDIVKEFDIYNKLSKIADVYSNTIKIDYLYTLANNLSKLGYTYLDFNNYLIDVFSRDKDIKYRINNGGSDAVIMTNFHKSKGLEYNIVYYPCLNYGFNDADKKGKTLFSKNSGIVLTSMIENKGLIDTILKQIYISDYDAADIGEKIRLFYVALTRAKEKMILVSSFDETLINDEAIIDDNTKTNINSYKDMLSLIKNDLDPYITPLDLNTLSINDDYKKISNAKSLTPGNKLTIEQLKEYEPKLNKESHFSKSVGLISKDTKDKLDFGTKMHYYLEVLDFNNPDYSLLDNKYALYIKSFLESDLMANRGKAKIYKEYEFIYLEDSEEKHGVIDLLMEYDDHFDIIDYKLKNIDDENYDKQLNGYRAYIESISNKTVNCYLYSILETKCREVKKS